MLNALIASVFSGKMACPQDGIHARVMTALADELRVKPLSIFYQQSWLTGIWPM